MWSEEWDNKFREAASRDNLPADPETGWQTMLPRLDKHLPQRRNRRRFFFILLLSGLLGTATYFALDKRMQPTVEPAAHNSETAAGQNPPSTTSTGAGDNKTIRDIVAADNREVPFIINDDEDQAREDRNPQTADQIQILLSRETGSGFRKRSTTTTANRREADQQRTGNHVDSHASTEPVSFTRNNRVDDPRNTIQRSINMPTHTDNDSIDFSKPGSTHLAAANPDDSSSHHPPTPSIQKSPRWSVSLMGGADISAVRPSQPGGWRNSFGITMGFAINDRWTIRAGFMRSRKVYDAAGKDYNPPPRFWNYVSELNRVDANCLVYELPLNAQYFFTNNRKGNWFASAGLHSLLMKNETYRYDYKDLMGRERNLTMSYKNYSNHYFGLINLSGGYKLRLSRNFSISAEPYVQIPIGGVGYGKVKLYSGGLLFSATISK